MMKRAPTKEGKRHMCGEIRLQITKMLDKILEDFCEVEEIPGGRRIDCEVPPLDDTKVQLLKNLRELREIFGC